MAFCSDFLARFVLAYQPDSTGRISASLYQIMPTFCQLSINHIQTLHLQVSKLFYIIGTIPATKRNNDDFLHVFLFLYSFFRKLSLQLAAKTILRCDKILMVFGIFLCLLNLLLHISAGDMEVPKMVAESFLTILSAWVAYNFS